LFFGFSRKKTKQNQKPKPKATPHVNNKQQQTTTNNNKQQQQQSRRTKRDLHYRVTKTKKSFYTIDNVNTSA